MATASQKILGQSPLMLYGKLRKSVNDARRRLGGGVNLWPVRAGDRRQVNLLSAKWENVRHLQMTGPVQSGPPPSIGLLRQHQCGLRSDGYSG
jgi:hypothetical protein